MNLEKQGGLSIKERMTTVKKIEEAVEHLPPKGLSQFRSWFEEFESASWDQQFEADARNFAFCAFFRG